MIRYSGVPRTITQDELSGQPPLEQRAAAVRDIILESVMLGRLDKTDLLIIAARDCSPMPSIRQVAIGLGLHHETVRRKVCHIKSLVSLCLIDA